MPAALGIALQLPGQIEFDLQVLAGQTQGDGLAAAIALAGQGQFAQIGFARRYPARLQIQMPLLPLVQASREGQAGNPLIVVADVPALQLETRTRRLTVAGQVQAAGGATLQAGPQLMELRQGDVHAALQAAVQPALAMDAVVAQAQVQTRHLPGRTVGTGVELQRRGATAQGAAYLQIGLRLQGALLQASLAAQRASQLAGQQIGRAHV